MPFLILLGIGAFLGWGYLLDGEPTMCQARTKFVARQVPFALELLAARHPVTVGIGRAFLNRNGALDQFVQGGFIASATTDVESTCAVQAMAMHIAPDQIRNAMADELEKGLNLKDMP